MLSAAKSGYEFSFFSVLKGKVQTNNTSKTNKRKNTKTKTCSKSTANPLICVQSKRVFEPFFSLKVFKCLCISVAVRFRMFCFLFLFGVLGIEHLGFFVS